VRSRTAAMTTASNVKESMRGELLPLIIPLGIGSLSLVVLGPSQCAISVLSSGCLNSTAP
jgi:hypothetical protein